MSRPTTSYANAEDLAQRLPNARLEPIEDSYAFVPEDQPEQLTELIREFAG
ncbi:MAG: alpha/beta hydrolase [Solirubrobacterales bacterium]|nr:alpha/beta hydrolase [Solirubrobacterales bacterium]